MLRVGPSVSTALGPKLTQPWNLMPLRIHQFGASNPPRLLLGSCVSGIESIGLAKADLGVCGSECPAQLLFRTAT